MAETFQIPRDPQRVVDLHFSLLHKREELMKAGRHAEALPFAIQDTWLTPALVQADRGFRMNREDAILDVVSCAMQMKQPEAALPHVRWAFEARLIPSRTLFEYTDDLASNMQFDGADQARVKHFLTTAVGQGVVSQEQADEILEGIEW